MSREPEEPLLYYRYRLLEAPEYIYTTANITVEQSSPVLPFTRVLSVGYVHLYHEFFIHRVLH
jgi:hypothetical protein